MNYPRKPMKKILLSLSLLLLTLLFATNTLAASGKLEQDDGPYHVIMQTNPENFMANQAGTMTMIITNKATGQPVTGAKVMMSKSTMMSSNAGSNSGNMDGMTMSSSMDTQGGTAMQEQSNMGGMTMNSGSYMMEGMTFNQPGQWNQAITISSPLGDSTVNFPITVGKSGPNLVLIGSVAGVVVIVGLLAAMLKRKKN
ncbi:hypothetical protein [Desulfosporosinus metallidurans]|uniref:YtkA-like domain-containing protein n=1 Tax=Desulfosporosinus metallidurans TaxID=1888891 RepID=A0A1Q8QH92_9FIRM|nr:hypothetical protein [Desulfosporosinus metallidurans]OLN26706.1 hypothetical protein DSOL_4860 [Desulfosporosinus metallidurans]